MEPFTASQLRKLCTGKPTATPGYHPSHKCKDVYLITPTGGPVCFYAHNPGELKNRMAWHWDAMKEWLADPLTRRALEREIRKSLCDSKEDALRMATSIHTTRFIEGGKLFFVSKHYATGGLSISQL